MDRINRLVDKTELFLKGHPELLVIKADKSNSNNAQL